MAAALISGADQVLLNRFLPGGRGLANAGRLALDRDQVKVMLATASYVLQKAGRPGSLGTETPFCVSDPSLYPGVHVGTRCSAATHFFTVGPSGLIRVCNHSEVSLAHVTEWRKLKDDPYWKTFVFRRHVPPECRGCDRAASCDAGCREAAHIVTGSLNAPDPVIPPEAIRACAGSAAETASGHPAGRSAPL
jgi:radical SAM protein with 4Fe4S-binding SPASM domain